MATSMFTRWLGRKSPRRMPISNTRRLSVELLEDRVVPTVAADFVTLQQGLQSFLDNVDSVVEGAVSASQAKLPIVEKSFGELTGTTQALTDFKTSIDNVLAQIGQLQTANLEQDAEALLNKYLGDGPDGIDILKEPANVTLPTNGSQDLIKINLHLGKSLASPSYTFGFGLPSIPFATIEANGTFTFDVGFEIPNLVIGLHADATPFVDPFQVQLAANANLTDPDLHAELGFLDVHVGENPTNPDGTNLSVTLGVGVNASNLNNLSVSAPALNGSANIDLMINGAINDAEIAAPNVDANFVLHWNFLNSQAATNDSTFGSDLYVAFQDVRINLGTYLTNMVGSAVQKIQQFVEPYKEFFELMDEPIPVISDLAKIVGDNDGVSLLDVATILNNTGVIPPDYQYIVTLAKTVIRITNVINQIQTDKASEIQNAYIKLGTFDLVGNQGNPGSPGYKDIRDVAPAEDSGFGKQVTDINWSSLQSITDSIDLEALKQQIKDVVGEDLGNELGEALDALKNPGSQGGNFAKIDLQFPITDHPAQSIFGLLIGHDTDLVSFTAEAKLDASGSLPVFNYQGFEISLFGGLHLDAKLKLAYDTYGLRHMVYDFFSPPPGGVTGETIGLNLLEGLYITPDTHFNLDVTVGIKGGVNWELLQAYVKGHLDAGVHILIPDGTDANGDGAVRPSEFNPNLFTINGAISGGLEFVAKVGIDPLSISETITIAEGQIASFNIGGVNPFEPSEDVVLATRDSTGKLTLNMGSLARRTARNYKVSEINEKFIITHSDPRDGDLAGEAVNVTFGGFTQRFQGIKSIVADGADGNDSISIDEGVAANVNLQGGIGNDVLKAEGTGTATLNGGDGDDTLIGGIGTHTLNGGNGADDLTAGRGNAIIHGNAGNDTIVGGIGTNQLFGDANDDYITGGTGANVIFGGDGNDHLIAGPKNNESLSGDAGNDYFEIGAGTGTYLGGLGNDHFIWHFVDPDANIVTADGAAKINGGGGLDQATFFGGPTDDFFTVSKTVNNLQYDLQVLTPFAGEGGGLNFFTLNLLAQVENIDVEGGKGVDNITVNELTNTRIFNVGVNLTDMVENYYGIGDGVVDHVTINGRQVADNVTISAEKLVIQEPPPGKKEDIKGGVTKIVGLPEYTIRVANVADDLVFNAKDGNDTINVKGITGPTLVHGNGNAAPGVADDDVFNVSASKIEDYATELNIEADRGANKIHVTQLGTTPDTFVLQTNRIESSFLKAVNFVATSGDFTKGVTLTTGDGADTVNVRSTLNNVTTLVETKLGDDFVNVSSNAPLSTGGLEKIQGTLSVDVGGGTANTLKLSDAGTASGNQNVVAQNNQVLGFVGPLDNTPIFYKATGGDMTLWLEGSNNSALSERFLVNNPIAKLRISGNDGNDRIDVTALTKSALLEGMAGNDTITIGYGVNKLDGIHGAITVDAGAGVDQLNLSDVQAGAGRKYGLSSNIFIHTVASPLWFGGSLETLNLSASKFADEILVVATPSAGTVNINANLGTDKLTGPNVDTNWVLSQLNKGTLGSKVQFVDVESLQGGAANDNFALKNGQNGLVLTGTIKGGGGIGDTLDYSAYTTPATINLQTKTATNIGGWDQIKRFVGGATTGDKLVGPNLTNIWKVQGKNSGQIETLAMGMFDYVGIENLQGGTSNDIFQFTPTGRLAGSIVGLTGSDTLDYSQFGATMPVRVNLAQGKATLVDGGVAGIDNVAGGAGDDILVGNSTANQLYGNGGRDILIGGVGIDILNGGAGDDILISGSTSFDGDAAFTALNAIMTEWSSNQEYATRRLHLLGLLERGLNGEHKLTNSTVQPDLDIDKLTGGNDVDWFWGTANEVLDLNAAIGEKIGAN